MKKLLLILSVLLLAMSAGAQSSATFNYSIVSSDEVRVTGLSSGSGDIEIPNTVVIGSTTYKVTSVSDYAFRSNSSITSVKFNENMRTIGQQAFINCSSLASISFAPGLQTIGVKCFQYCNLTELVLPSSVITVGGGSFADNPNLETVFVNGSLGSQVFARDRIKTVTFGANTTDLSYEILYSCGPIESVYCYAATPPTFDRTFNAANLSSDALFYVPAESLDAYAQAPGWSAYASRYRPIHSGSVTFEDGEDYTPIYEQPNLTIIYKRTFKNTNWQPLYIPFSMDYEEWSEWADVAEISGVHEYNDGTTLIEFRTVTSGAINPNTPYIIRAKEASETPVNISLENKTLYAAATGTVWCASTRRKYTLTGIYEAQDNLTGALVMSAGNFYAISSPATSLKAQRFYLTVTDEDHGYGTGSAQAPRHVGVMVDGEVDDELTILTPTTLTPALSLKGEGEWYNLQGQKVGPDYKGIVIINGKKVLRK